MKLAAGNLNKRITIERYTSPVDSWDVGTWAVHLSLWADVKQAKQAEVKIKDELRVVTTYHIWIREADVTSKDRIIYDNKTLDIKSVITDDDKAMYIEAYDNG